MIEINKRNGAKKRAQRRWGTTSFHYNNYKSKQQAIINSVKKEEILSVKQAGVTILRSNKDIKTSSFEFIMLFVALTGLWFCILLLANYLLKDVFSFNIYPMEVPLIKSLNNLN